MKVDPVLLKEVKNAVGATRAERLKFAQVCHQFADELGKAIRKNDGMLKNETIFNRVFLQYPRSVAACCIAATIASRDGTSYQAKVWAQGVLEAWRPTKGQAQRAYIDDNLNPDRIEEYNGGFIRATTIN